MDHHVCGGECPGQIRKNVHHPQIAACAAGFGRPANRIRFLRVPVHRAPNDHKANMRKFCSDQLGGFDKTQVTFRGLKLRHQKHQRRTLRNPLRITELCA